MENKSTRLEYIDIAKGIGLILVVFGHLFSYNGELSIIIFSFHMPLFFFISGYCFCPHKYNDFESFLVKKVKHLVIPYLIFSTLGFVVSLIIPSWRKGLSTYSLVEVFFNTQPESLHVGQIWFLICLFWVEILAYWIYKFFFSGKNAFVITLSLIVFALIGYNIAKLGTGLFIYGRFPFKLDTALSALVFYFAGFYFRKLNLKCFYNWKGLLIGVIFAFLNIVISVKYLGWVNICALIFNNIILYYICAFLGIIAVFCISINLSKIKWLSNLGKESLILFSTHSFLIYFSTYILSKILGYQVINGENIPTAYSLIIGIIIVLLFVMIINIKRGIFNMQMIQNISKEKKTRFILYSIILVAALIFFFTIILSRGTNLSEVFFCAINDTYMDFFNSVYDVSMRRPYEKGTIYPPLCYLIYYICNRFVPEEVIDETWYHFPGGNTIKATQGGQLSFFVFISIVLVLIGILIYNYIKLSKRESILLVIAFFCSAPVLYSIERGNIILYSFLFALVFILCYRNTNKYIREFGLISLALSAGIKIYPAILGVLLIRERRFKEAARTMLYGIIIFLVPFVFFGGLSEVSVLIDNILKNAQDFSTSVGGLGYKINFSNTIKIVNQLLAININNTQVIATILSFLLFISSFFQKDLWKQVALLCLIIIGYPSFSYNYTAIFMFIPWFIFLNTTKHFGKLNMIYGLLFSFLFMCLPLGILPIESEWPVTGNTLFSSLCLVIMAILLICDTVFQIINNIKMTKIFKKLNQNPYILRLNRSLFTNK